MDSNQIQLIMSSWEKVSQDPMLIHSFYSKLFEIAPQTKSYFPNDVSKQSEKLAYTLGFVVGNLNRLDVIENSIEDLGRTHKRLKIKDEEYDFVKKALLLTLDEALEGDNHDALDAWDVALTHISNLMMNAKEEIVERRPSLLKRLFSRS